VRYIDFLNRALLSVSVWQIVFVLAGAPAPLLAGYVRVADEHEQILNHLGQETAKPARAFMEKR
jgi:hypothetical protein